MALYILQDVNECGRCAEHMIIFRLPIFKLVLFLIVPTNTYIHGHSNDCAVRVQLLYINGHGTRSSYPSYTLVT